MTARSITLLALSLLLTGPYLVYGQTDAALLQEAARQTEAIRATGQGWPVIETRFFRIHHQPEIIPSKIARAELDRFTAETAIKVGLDEAAIKNLEARKLDYYLCDDNMVQAATGHPTRGMADLRGRAVISSHFPHFHELAHLLVDMTFAETPAQTLPVVQEGLACLLGGRWGRSPEVVLYTGWVNDHFGMGTLADVLTQEAWNSFGGGADVAYPLGALLCETVRRQAGWAGVMELNRRVAGSVAMVAGLDQNTLMNGIVQAGGWDSRTDFQEALVSVLEDHRRCGVVPLVSGETIEISGRCAGERGMVRLGDGHVWEVEAPDFPVFVLSAPEEANRAKGGIFGEHLPGRVYLGERWGLRVSPDSISFYDFGINQLVGIWVAGFTGEQGTLGTDGGPLRFRLEVPDIPDWSPAVVVQP